jgi:hypothetical protein
MTTPITSDEVKVADPSPFSLAQDAPSSDQAAILATAAHVTSTVLHIAATRPILQETVLAVPCAAPTVQTLAIIPYPKPYGPPQFHGYEASPKLDMSSFRLCRQDFQTTPETARKAYIEETLLREQFLSTPCAEEELLEEKITAHRNRVEILRKIVLQHDLKGENYLLNLSGFCLSIQLQPLMKGIRSFCKLAHEKKQLIERSKKILEAEAALHESHEQNV